MSLHSLQRTHVHVGCRNISPWVNTIFDYQITHSQLQPQHDGAPHIDERLRSFRVEEMAHIIDADYLSHIDHCATQ